METYYDPADLAAFGDIGKDAPHLAAKFFDYYGAVFAEGALSEREKALIALAVAHAVSITVRQAIAPPQNVIAAECQARTARAAAD